MPKMNAGRKIELKELALIYLTLFTPVSCLTITPSTNAEMPDTSFACQIQHASQGIRLELVQANSKNEAIDVANLDKDAKNRVIDVIECIVIGEEKFRDKTFEKRFNSTPR